MALPSSDRIFSERASKSITRVSGKIGKALSERGQILKQYPFLLREKSTLATARPVEVLKPLGNPYLDYKVRVIREVLSSIVKFILGLLFGLICVALISKYMTPVSPEVLNLLDPIPITEIAPAGDLTPDGEWHIDDVLVAGVLCIEGGILLGIAYALIPVAILPMVTAIASEALLEISPLLHLGIFF